MRNIRYLLLTIYAVVIVPPVSAAYFNSSLKMKVFVRGSDDIPDRVIGFTPASRHHRIPIPIHDLWYVRPAGSLNGSLLDKLAHEIRLYSIPGLDLSDHWELSDASLSHLRSIPSLRMLDLSRTRVTDKGLHSFRSLRNLAILILPDAMTNKGLADLRSLPNIRDLNLDRTHVTNAGLKVLASFAHLEKLDLSGTFVTDEGLAVLAQLPHLSHLVLNGNTTDAAAPYLKTARSLEEVDLSQTQMSDEGMTALAALPRLNTIYINKKIGDRGLRNLAQSKSLRTLDLTGAAITDKGVKDLAHLKSLQELALTETPVGNACLSFVAELPNLRMLELSDTHVTSAGLAPLAHLPKLEIISLSWQTLSREDLKGLAQLAHLKTIILNGVPLPQETMADLRHFGHLSPWEEPRGIARAGLQPEEPNQSAALAAPVAVKNPIAPLSHFAEAPVGAVAVKGISPATAGTVSLPTTSRSTGKLPAMASRGLSAPALPVPALPGPDIPAATATPEKISANLPATAMGATSSQRLQQAKVPQPLNFGGATPSSSASPDIAAAPSTAGAKSPNKADEDQLLKVIVLQSQPSKGGAFSGLAGMKQVRLAENTGSISDVAVDPKQAAIAVQEDRPEDSLGEINVNAKH